LQLIACLPVGFQFGQHLSQIWPVFILARAREGEQGQIFLIELKASQLDTALDIIDQQGS
jgi:hypothetical protein